MKLFEVYTLSTQSSEFLSFYDFIKLTTPEVKGKKSCVAVIIFSVPTGKPAPGLDSLQRFFLDLPGR